MRRINRHTWLLLALLLLLSASCSARAVEVTKFPGHDLSEQVHLVFYMVGERSPDEEGMLEELNRMLLRDINATVEFKWMDWNEVLDKYPLILASGEVFDGCYATNWLDFYKYVQRGAFQDITDLLPGACPDIVRMASEDTWQSVTFRGRIYGIPRDGEEEFNMDGIIYREDLRKKHGVPPITRMEDFEAYFQAIRDHEPGMKPSSLDFVNDHFYTFLYFHQLSGMELYNALYVYYGFVTDPKDQSGKMIPFYEVPAYRDMVTLMNRWQSKGFWTAADLANNNYANNITEAEIGAGTAAAWGVTASHYHEALEFIKEYHPDWELGFYYRPSEAVRKDRTDTMEDGAAISVSSKNPERALMAINQMITQPEYIRLLTYGVEGRHYVINKDGYPAYPEGVTADTAGYRIRVHPFGWLAYGPDVYQKPHNLATDILLEMQEQAITPALLGFYFDTTQLTVEISDIADVLIQYEKPLRWGFVKASVDEDIAELKAQLEMAGIEKVRAELERQVAEYLDRQGN